MFANPKESAAILAKAYGNVKPEIAEIAVKNMAEIGYWGRSDFDIKGMNEFTRGLRIIGEVKGEIFWEKIIDRSFLPADLRGTS